MSYYKKNIRSSFLRNIHTVFNLRSLFHEVRFSGLCKFLPKGKQRLDLGNSLPVWYKGAGWWFKSICLIVLVLSLFSCGLLDGLGSATPRLNLQDSRSEDESAGVFNNPSGPLESENVCFDNSDCVQLCDSMLNRFSEQEKCYDHKEKEVQSFRDTYNALAIGNPRKLIQVDPEKIEKFLIFGPELWKTAINGFERGRIEDCEASDPENPPEDIRNYENCKFEYYYQQVGYWSSGASATLEWIAKNDWLSKLILEHDDDHIIIQTLLEVLSNGGKGEAEDREEKRDAGESGYDGDSICDLDSAGGDGKLDLDSLPTGVQVPGSYRDHYQAFGANCIDGKSLSYMLLAVEEDNKDSVNLGHQVLEELCNSQEACIRYFYCRINDVDGELNNIGTAPTPPAPILTPLFLYMNDSGINNWNRGYNDCVGLL
ncbi:MAG: hypothetical protein OXM55_07630 [Bdellovibrionales bacterium]|nr:hypothetical protein [Bdellovibrionales bacterium]